MPIDPLRRARALYFLRQRRQPKIKLKRTQILAIVRDPRKQIDIAKAYGIHRAHVSNIKTGRCWNQFTLGETDYRGQGPGGERHHNARLTADQVRAIHADQRTHTEIAKAYNLSRGQVGNIKTGARWKSLKLTAGGNKTSRRQQTS